jgi:hypothetical protein
MFPHLIGSAAMLPGRGGLCVRGRIGGSARRLARATALEQCMAQETSDMPTTVRRRSILPCMPMGHPHCSRAVAQGRPPILSRTLGLFRDARTLGLFRDAESFSISRRLRYAMACHTAGVGMFAYGSGRRRTLRSGRRGVANPRVRFDARSRAHHRLKRPPGPCWRPVDRRHHAAAPQTVSERTLSHGSRRARTIDPDRGE